MMPLLTGCGSGVSGSEPPPTPLAATASLAWSPVEDSSILGYFVYYGRQSQDQQGSCSYESSMYVDIPSVTVINLEPSTRYYFAVSAYNGIESACSHEVSTVTSADSGQNDPPIPSRPPDEFINRPDVIPDESRVPGQRL
ncbi:MAG TPA: fibronectin type III domain-containing protein [Nitrospiraceae bacterium]